VVTQLADSSSLTGFEPGVLLLAFPKVFVSVANSMIGAQAWWVAVCIAAALVGLYLTYVGWAPATSRPTPQAARETKDVP
jgi:hypothetical protein